MMLHGILTVINVALILLNRSLTLLSTALIVAANDNSLRKIEEDLKLLAQHAPIPWNKLPPRPAPKPPLITRHSKDHLAVSSKPQLELTTRDLGHAGTQLGKTGAPRLNVEQTVFLHAKLSGLKSVACSSVCASGKHSKHAAAAASLVTLPFSHSVGAPDDSAVRAQGTTQIYTKYLPSWYKSQRGATLKDR